MYTLTAHQTTTEDEDTQDGMDFRPRALRPHAQRQLLQDPALLDPIRHRRHDGQRRRDGRSLEILRLSCRIFGQGGDGDVEASQPRQAAQDEEGQ